MSQSALVTVDGVCRRYSAAQQAVLDGVSLEVDAGTSVAITGDSGAGKSTLLNVIAGLDMPDSGIVTWQVGGRALPLAELTDDERTRLRRSFVGFVFQSFNLIPTLTARDNVLLPLRLAGVRDPDREAAALATLEGLEIGDRLDAFPETLSGGEQQRVAIARALAMRPPLVLADEPTGNLDQRNSERVFRLLLDRVRDAGSALVLVTHNPLLAGAADRTVELVDGSLAEQP